MRATRRRLRCAADEPSHSTTDSALTPTSTRRSWNLLTPRLGSSSPRDQRTRLATGVEVREVWRAPLPAVAHHMAGSLSTSSEVFNPLKRRISRPRSRKTTTPTPTPREISVFWNCVCVRVLLSVKVAEALRMSLTPARIPMTRNGRTGKTDARRCPKTVWAMSEQDDDHQDPVDRPDDGLREPAPVAEEVDDGAHEDDARDEQQARDDRVLDGEDDPPDPRVGPLLRATSSCGRCAH